MYAVRIFVRKGALAEAARRKAGDVTKRAQCRNGETVKRETENGRNI